MTRGSSTLYVKDEIAQRRCVLCGKGYAYCRCRCTWCGAPKWTKDGPYFVHHVCKGKAGK